MKEESLLLLSDLQKLINQVVLIDYTIIILGGDEMGNDRIGVSIYKGEKRFLIIPEIRHIGGFSVESQWY